MLKLEDMIPGRKADHIPDSEFDAHELAMGIKVEMEHTDDPVESKRIAKEHLLEDPKYYTKLDTAGLADELHESKVGDYYITIGETLEEMEKSYKKLNKLISKMEYEDNSPEILNLRKVENAIFDLKKNFGDSYDFSWSRIPSKRKLDVRGLMDTLDKTETFDKYHNKNAYPEDYTYINIPIDLLSRYGFTEKILDKIQDNTADYQGYIYTHKDEVSISHGDG